MATDFHDSPSHEFLAGKLPKALQIPAKPLSNKRSKPTSRKTVTSQPAASAQASLVSPTISIRSISLQRNVVQCGSPRLLLRDRQRNGVTLNFTRGSSISCYMGSK